MSRAILHRISGHRHGPNGLINRLLSPEDALANQLKPFVFIDNLSGEVPPNFGFGFHPHSGIATLTYHLNKDVQYTDTEGHDGVLKALGLEWMKAGGGAWHRGTIVGTGPITAFQLWLTLPPSLEEGPSFSQYVPPNHVPEVDNVRVLLGSYGGKTAAIQPPTPMTYLDVSLKSTGDKFTFDVANQEASWAFVFEGSAKLGNDSEPSSQELLVLSDDGAVEFTAVNGPCRFLVASAKRHAFSLHVGYSSVHTSADALANGEARIQELKEELQRQGKI